MPPSVPELLYLFEIAKAGVGSIALPNGFSLTILVVILGFTGFDFTGLCGEGFI